MLNTLELFFVTFLHVQAQLSDDMYDNDFKSKEAIKLTDVIRILNCEQKLIFSNESYRFLQVLPSRLSV